jgi:spore coat polysaccharide biosynthesis protein SpsF (cytidylyltransferase family)
MSPPRPDAVVIQARIGSTRLPGKVLMDLAGRTVLAHVIERCAAIPGINAVCCAIPEGPANDPVEAEARRAGAVTVRGPERDVLERYRLAAETLDAGAVMRVTSDCPLIDPVLCGEVLSAFHALGADMVANDIVAGYPHGLGCEVFSRAWLERASREASAAPDREHVSLYILDHPEVALWGLIGPGGAVARHRWTLDTPNDYRLIGAIMERLPPGPAGWSWRAALDVLAGAPDLAGESARLDQRGAP